ncbi:hypothetical protein R1sor_017870 [Riccia sorocarpa]|uniref:Uncharacterized protein n=1 Tax=Riccia sorocarpa TaxID=122646 RepID=A0ABD3I877_9MARC
MGDRSGSMLEDRVRRGFEAAKEQLMRMNARNGPAIGSGDNGRRAENSGGDPSTQGNTISQQYQQSPVATDLDAAFTISKGKLLDLEEEDFPPLAGQLVKTVKEDTEDKQLAEDTVSDSQGQEDERQAALLSQEHTAISSPRRLEKGLDLEEPSGWGSSHDSKVAKQVGGRTLRRNEGAGLERN